MFWLLIRGGKTKLPASKKKIKVTTQLTRVVTKYPMAPPVRIRAAQVYCHPKSTKIRGRAEPNSVMLIPKRKKLSIST